jgi:hypothetical protein
MFPREHGAYGQLLFPLITALAIGHPGAAALCLSASAVCAFIAHEPLLVLLGHRGARAVREQGLRARRWLAASAAGAIASGAIAMALMPVAARIALAAPAAGGAIAAGLIVGHREHTAAGEVVVAMTLSSLALPVALTAAATVTAAATCAVVFAIGFVVATAAVHSIVSREPRSVEPTTPSVPGGAPRAMPRFAAAAVALLAIAGLALMSRAGVVHPIAPAAAMPMCGAALVVFSPSPRRLRRVGWMLVAATCAQAVMLVVALR